MTSQREAAKSSAEIDSHTPRLEEFAVWVLQVTAVAAAVIFGVWAPLSYNATVSGNSGSNDASSSMLKAVVSAKSEAKQAAETQSIMFDAKIDKWKR